MAGCRLAGGSQKRRVGRIDEGARTRTGLFLRHPRFSPPSPCLVRSNLVSKCLIRVGSFHQFLNVIGLSTDRIDHLSAVVLYSLLSSSDFEWRVAVHLIHLTDPPPTVYRCRRIFSSSVLFLVSRLAITTTISQHNPLLLLINNYCTEQTE